jgi:threonine dehydrogenase-like Zn-dependent dehydrogenase
MAETCRAAVFPGAVLRDLTRGEGADVVFDVATATATVPMAVDLARAGGRILLAGLKHFAEIPGLVTDHIVLKSLQLHGGAGFTPQSMADAVALIESGSVHADIVAGEVFDLDHIDDAMALLTRSDPTRDAVRVGLRHTHGSTS